MCGVALAPKERPRRAPQDTGASATRVRGACACLPSSTTRSMHQSTSTLDAHAHAHARGRASVRQGRASGCRARAKEEPAPSFRRPRGRSTQRNKQQQQAVTRHRGSRAAPFSFLRLAISILHRPRGAGASIPHQRPKATSYSRWRRKRWIPALELWIFQMERQILHWKSGSSSSSIIRKSARHSFGASGVHPYRLSPVCNRLYTHTLDETKPIIQTDGKRAIHGRGGRVDRATAGEN